MVKTRQLHGNRVDKILIRVNTQGFTIEVNKTTVVVSSNSLYLVFHQLSKIVYSNVYIIIIQINYKIQ